MQKEDNEKRKKRREIPALVPPIVPPPHLFNRADNNTLAEMSDVNRSIDDDTVMDFSTDVSSTKKHRHRR